MLRSRSGAVEVLLQACEDMMPGVVSLPHGFGQQRVDLPESPLVHESGVSCNDVTDAAYLDDLSGNAALNGVPVTLAALH